MLVEVGDESSELTPVAFCAPEQITAATAEHSQAKPLFKVLPAPPRFPSTMRNPAKSQRRTSNA